MGRTRIQLFGSPIVDRCGSVEPIPQSIQPLVAYLALERRSARHRERVMEALWPGVEPDRCRRRLNTAVWRLRSVLDRVGSSVVCCADTGHLELSADVEVDAREMLEVVEAGDDLAHDIHWAELVELEDAEFISGCYHQWVVETRLRLAHALSRCVEGRIERFRTSGDVEQALRCAHVLARREPYREEAHRSVIRLAVQLGRYDEAERQYLRCVEILRDELAVQPGAEARQQRLGEEVVELPDPSVLRALDDALRNCRDAVGAIEYATRGLVARRR